MRFRAALLSTALALCAASSFAANNPPLSGAWNIQPTGSAASTGELLFRMTPGDGSDPVEVTVSVLSGSSDVAVARDIRRTLSTRLRADQFNVQLGQGANVLVSDPLGKPNFSLELIDSDIENLRVVVQSVAPTASPTVPAQEAPAAPANNVPAGNTAPGNAVPPTAPSPGNSSQPAASPPANSPPNATPGGAPASAPSPNATPSGSLPASAPPPT
jgi:hypothetical protein